MIVTVLSKQILKQSSISQEINHLPCSIKPQNTFQLSKHAVCVQGAAERIKAEIINHLFSNYFSTLKQDEDVIHFHTAVHIKFIPFST